MEELARDTTRDLHNGRIKYTKKIDTTLHYHSEVELIYLQEGELDIFTENNTMHMTTGDVAILNPLDLHRLDPKSEDNVYLLVILPSHLSIKLSAEHIKSKLFTNISEDMVKILKLHKVFSKMQQNYIEIYFTLISEVIRDLYKMCDNAPDVSNSILEYIHDNYQQDITLSTVANACTTNRSYVSKTINTLTGYSFNNYVNKLRISYFLDHFTNSNTLTIDALARESGFNNPRTFYRAFTKELKCSPNDYIKKNSNI